MRSFMLAAIACISLAGCEQPPVDVPEVTAEETATSFNPEGLPTIVIDVPSMECEHCAAGACDAVAKQSGVVDVLPNVTDKNVTIAYDEAMFDKQAALEAMQSAFSDACFAGEESDVATEEADKKENAAEKSAKDKPADEPANDVSEETEADPESNE